MMSESAQLKEALAKLTEQTNGELNALQRLPGKDAPGRVQGLPHDWGNNENAILFECNDSDYLHQLLAPFDGRWNI